MEGLAMQEAVTDRAVKPIFTQLSLLTRQPGASVADEHFCAS